MPFGDALRPLIIAALFLPLFLVGCATKQIVDAAGSQSNTGNYEAALATLERGLAEHPDSIELRKAQLTLRQEATSRLLQLSEARQRAGDTEAAEALIRRLLAIDPSSAIGQSALVEIERTRRAQRWAKEAQSSLSAQDWDAAGNAIDRGLREDPRNQTLLGLQRQLDSRRRLDETASIRLADTRPISLEFREANLKMVLEALSRTTGVNFIVDRDVRTDQRVTIFLRQTKLEDALNVLTSTNQLAVRILNANTALVYPNTPEKAREYKDLLIRAFYLANADVKQTANLLRSMLKLRDVFVDEKANMLVVRDTPEAIRLAERLIALHDFGEPEVMLEVELLEVTSTRLTDLGIRFPDSITLTPLSATGATGLKLDDLRDINSSRIAVSTPTVTVNLKREVGDLNVLANPRIRAKSREKAQILIGDKVPIITTTATSTGFVSESVQYVDVGIKLNVEPLVHFDDEVSIKMGLEVGSLIREIRTATGSLAYQIGTRTASTTLRLKDGETQILAGLISNAERSSANRLPGLGDLPIAGRLFSTQRDDRQRTEVVLAITPRLVRGARSPLLAQAEFWSGSENVLRSSPLTLASETRSAPRTAADVAAAANRPVEAPGRVERPMPGSQSGERRGVAAATPADSAISRRLPTRVEAAIQGPPEVKAGQTFDVQFTIDTDGGINALPIQIAFDPTRLQIIDVIEGDFFRQEGGQTTFARQVVPETGRILVSAQRNGGEPVRGKGSVVTLKLKAVVAGTARLSIASASALGTSGTPPAVILPVPLDIKVN